MTFMDALTWVGRIPECAAVEPGPRDSPHGVIQSSGSCRGHGHQSPDRDGCRQSGPPPSSEFKSVSTDVSFSAETVCYPHTIAGTVDQAYTRLTGGATPPGGLQRKAELLAQTISEPFRLRWQILLHYRIKGVRMFRAIT